MDIRNIKTIDLLTLVNAELKKNKNLSVSGLCKKLDIKKSTLTSRLNKEKYYYDFEKRQYIKVIEPVKNNITNKNIEIDSNMIKEDIEEVAEMVINKGFEEVEQQKNNNENNAISNITTLNDEELKNIKFIANNMQDVINTMQVFKGLDSLIKLMPNASAKQEQEQHEHIAKKKFNITRNESTVKTLRLYVELYEELKKRAFEEKITQQEILNKALLEYFNNH